MHVLKRAKTNIQASLLSILNDPIRNWTTHNLIAHPLSEWMHLAGFTNAGNRLHDRTLPKNQPGEDRG